MNFNTNQTSLRTEEPSKKLLRRSLAATPVPLEPSIAEPTIDHNITAPDFAAKAAQTTPTGIQEAVDFKGRLYSRAAAFPSQAAAKILDATNEAAELTVEFGKNARYHKLKYNDWKMVFFVLSVIYAVLNYVSMDESIFATSLRQARGLYENAMHQNDDFDHDAAGDGFESSLRITRVVTDLMCVVFPAIVFAGYLTCPAIIMNILLLPIVIQAAIVSFIVTILPSGSFVGVILTMIFLGDMMMKLLGRIRDITRDHFSNTIDFPLVNLGRDNEMVIERQKWEQGLLTLGESAKIDFHNTVGFYMGPYKSNVFVKAGDESEHGVAIDNSTGQAKDFIRELRKIVNRPDMMIHYITKDSVVYSKRHMNQGERYPKASIHGMKMTKNGIERKELWEYSYDMKAITDNTLLAKHQHVRHTYGVWTEIHDQLFQDENPDFDFIPDLKSVFEPSTGPWKNN